MQGKGVVKVENLNIINKENKEGVKGILTCYRTKPDIPYIHIECELEGHHIDFTYKSRKNFGNSIHQDIRSYRLYIGTRKATENDLRRLL